MIRKELLLLLLICSSAGAQDSIALDEVEVSDRQLRRFSNSQPTMHLNDSVIHWNRSSLTSLLENNSTIFFRQNGYGMVSSASFRGTTAQQTAVIWNGINVNSQFNGQTDFNSISTADFNSVTIRSGGGSAIYGSSAIGGTVHLENRVTHRRGVFHRIVSRFGSFDTSETNYRINAANDNLAVSASVTYNASANDYSYPEGGRNINGQFHNSSLSTAAAFKIDESNQLRFYMRTAESEKHFSLISPGETRTKYADFSSWNLAEWKLNAGRWSNSAKVAYLEERYKFFPEISNNVHDYGKASTVIAKYDATFSAGRKFLINAIADYSSTRGSGSDIESNSRQIAGSSILLKHQITEKMQYELGLRTEITTVYKSPLLYSAGIIFKSSDWLKLRANISKNFRMPTFNDLYWTHGGNPDLKPETSFQGEAGADIVIENIQLSISGYQILISDMIQWLPGTSTVWNPGNVRKVRSRGIEVSAEWQKNFGPNQILLSSSYAYTVSENEETGKQLIYVPFHKFTASVGYSRSKFSMIAQMLFNGEMFSRSDNNPRYNTDPFFVANLSAAYSLVKSATIGFQAANIFNESYQTVVGRTMPGINYNVFLKLNL